MFKDFYFAFIQFQKLDNAKKAIESHKYPELGGFKCRVLPFNKQYLGLQQGPNAKKTKVLQLFVKGLPAQWTHEDLAKAFEECGTVVSAKVSIDGNYKSRGYGFVQMSTE